MNFQIAALSSGWFCNNIIFFHLQKGLYQSAIRHVVQNVMNSTAQFADALIQKLQLFQQKVIYDYIGIILNDQRLIYI